MPIPWVSWKMVHFPWFPGFVWTLYKNIGHCRWKIFEIEGNIGEWFALLQWIFVRIFFKIVNYAFFMLFTIFYDHCMLLTNFYDFLWCYAAWDTCTISPLLSGKINPFFPEHALHKHTYPLLQYFIVDC